MPATLRTAIGLLALQLFAGAALTIWLLYLDIAGDAESRTLGLYVTIFTGLYAAAFGFTMQALVRRKLAARGVAVALELLLLAPVYYMITGGAKAIGLPLGIVCIGVIAALFAPQTSKALS